MTIIPSTTESWVEMVGPSFLHKNRHAMDEKTTCTFPGPRVAGINGSEDRDTLESTDPCGTGKIPKR